MHPDTESTADTGSPFTNPTEDLPVPNAHSFKVLDHDLNILFTSPFTMGSWHNFAIQVDWTNRTLAIFHSVNSELLQPVTRVLPNLSVGSGATGQGDFHIAVLKASIWHSTHSMRDLMKTAVEKT